MFKLKFLLLLIICSQFPNFSQSQNKIEASEISKKPTKEEAVIFAKLANKKREIVIITQDKYLNPVTSKLKDGDSLVLNTNSTNIIKIFNPVKSFPVDSGDKVEITLTEDNSTILKDLNNNKEKQQELNLFNDYDEWYQKNYESDVKKIREKAFSIPYKNIDSIKKFNNIFFNDLKKTFLVNYEHNSTEINNNVKENFLSFYQVYNLFWNFQNIAKSFPKNEEAQYKAWKEIVDYTNKRTNIITLNLLSDATNKLFSQQNNVDIDKIIQQLNSNLNPNIRDLLLYRLVLSVNDTSTFKTYLNKFNSVSSNDYFRKLLNEKYENLQLVEKSPKTLVRAINDQNTSLEDVITQNRGKYILINFWASWCSPCLKELKVLVPESKKLNSKDIVFVYISVDTEKNAWINGAKNLKLEASPLSYLLLSHDGAYIQKNKVKSYPTNIIYNKEGNIIKTKIGEITIDEIKNICGID